jgi:hypothetical protein
MLRIFNARGSEMKSHWMDKRMVWVFRNLAAVAHSLPEGPVAP